MLSSTSCVAQEHRQRNDCDIYRDRNRQHRQITQHACAHPFSISIVVIHVEIKGCTRNPIMESEFHVEQFYLGPFSAFSGETLSIS